MMKNNSNMMLIVCIGLIAIISGCVGGQDINSAVKALPEVQQFMSEHPNATITVTYWSKEEVAKSAQEISQQCDKTITPIALYKAVVSEGDLKVVSWINAENQIVICSTTTGSGAASSKATPVYTTVIPQVTTSTITSTPAPVKIRTNNSNIGDAPEFWSINEPFNSISDALSITPVGVVSATYTDLESMTPQMMQWAKQDVTVINEADTIYNSTTTKVYYASLQEGKNNSFLLLNTMSPEKNDFKYVIYPQQIAGNYILVRQGQGVDGLYNVMGTPTILAPGDTVSGVLEIITSLKKTATAYDQYAGLLSKVEPAPYQILSSNASFARQYYMGIRFNNGVYERTTAYLDVNSNTLNKLNQLKTSSNQRGFIEYNITSSGDYTIVKIAGSDLFSIVAEETS